MKKLTIIVAIGWLSLPVLANAQKSVDPYEILDKHFEAIGGLENLKKQKTRHVKGTVEIAGTALSGTFEEWRETPTRYRQNVDLGVITQKSGDDGEWEWSIDHNGKLQIHRDEVRRNERKLRILMAEYDHLDPDSKYFTVSYDGLTPVDSFTCYTVLITNSLNSDTLIHYFDTTSYLLRRSDIIKPDGTAKTMISDYRDVDGVKEAYHQEITDFSTGMKQVVNLTLVETNHPVDTTLFASPSDDIKDFHFIEGNKAENIPFQYIEKHIYLPVTINGQQRLWVLDSGAGATVIEKGYADELGLELQGGLTGKGAGNLVDYSFTTLPPFSVRGLEFSAQKAVVIDIAWLFRQWIGMKIAGILGYDFLSRLVIKIDYANQLISFYDPEEFSYSGDGMIIDAPITGSNMFHVPLTVGKEHGGMWNLDLGAGGVGFHYPYAKEHKLLEMPGVDRIGAGAGGSHKERAVRFATVTFAGFTVPDMVVTFPTEEVEGAFSHSGLTGNIGNELLQHFTLYLDYARERVIVEKGKDFDSRFRRDNSGMQIYNREDGTTAVMHVAAGTPAEDAGFIAGDVILLANGKTPDELGGILALKELLKDDPGTVHTFVVNRDGVEVTLRLALRDLYSDRQ